MTPAALVLFDLDGTLVDGGDLPAAMRRTCQAIAARAGGVTADDLVAANTATWQALWPEIEDEYQLDREAAPAIEARAWAGTLAGCGLHDPALLDVAHAVWAREEPTAYHRYPDVGPALDALLAGGLRIGMVTNGASAAQRRKLRAVGLDGAFDPLVVSSEIGVRKPDAAIFAHALATAGTAAAATWFVGDNLWHDVPGAAEAGIVTVWLDRDGIGRGPDDPRPDVTIRSLAELQERMRGQDPR